MKELELFTAGGHGEALIVAELSANHDGSLSRALDTIAAAAEAGAGAVKIQTYTADTLTIDSAREEFVIRGGLWDGRTLYDLYREAHTPWEWHAELQAAAEQAQIAWFSTPFDATAVDLLEGLRVPAYKIASFELVDGELIACVARTGKPIIMSTGMATLAEIEGAVDTIRSTWGDADPGLALLQCVSAYPAHPQDINLRTMPDLARRFDAIPGLSDHTLGTAVSTAAVALGAKIIEKHFTLSREGGGPDSAFSLEPRELGRLVEDVRAAEAARGEVHYGPAPGEQANLSFRRSIFVTAPISKGERLTRENVRVIRPGHGLSPALLPQVLGRRAKVDLERGTPLQLELLD